MTLSGLMSHISPAVPNYNLPPVPNLDRTHWGGGGGGGGWKGGKGGNPNAALSALTLLAFLFFLNILQSCLRDTIGQNNGMLVMVLPPNSTATNRAKREVEIDMGSHEKEDYVKTQHQNWTDFDISNLVHAQVESYWSNKGNEARINPLNNSQTENKRVEINKNIWDPKAIVKNRISTKLILNGEEENETPDTSKMTQGKPDIDDTEKLIGTGSIANKDSQLVNGFWTKTISLLIKNSMPYVKKVICCSDIACEKKENQLSTNGLRRDNLIR